jgi:hypothetical protein
MSFFRYEGRLTIRHWLICGFLFALGLAWVLTTVFACVQASENESRNPAEAKSECPIGR